MSASPALSDTPAAPRPPRLGAWRWLAAVVLGVVAMTLRLALEPWLEGSVPFALAFPAVAVVALLAGWGPALVTTAVCAVFPLVPGLPPMLMGRGVARMAGLFAVSSLLVIAACGWLSHRTQGTQPLPADPQTDPALAEQGQHVQQWLRLLIALALLLPACFFLVTAWQSQRNARIAADERVIRSAIIAREHALKIMHMNELVFDRLNARVDTRSDEAIERERPTIELLMANTVRDLPDVRWIAIWGADGHLLASSEPDATGWPAGVQADCEQQLRGGASLCVSSQLATSSAAGLPGAAPPSAETPTGLVVGRARRGEHGESVGVFAIGLERHAFQEFYRDLLRTEHSGAVVLFRPDGRMLLREPWPSMPGTWGVAPGPLAEAVRRGGSAGELTVRSKVDGVPRLLSYRKVGDYPLYVASSLLVQSVNEEWYRNVAVLAAFTFPSALGLAWVSWVALRHTRRERLALERWRSETVKRVQVEDALRQTQRLEALGHLTGGVAHDVNNLLMVVSNNAYLLQRLLAAREGGRPVDARIAKPIDAILRAVTTGSRLTRQLLAFARRQALRPEVIRLQDRLPQLLDLMRHSISALVTLDGEVAADTSYIQVDPAELELALINLAVNARDAMPEGGQLRVEMRDARPDEHEGLGRWVSIAVSDTGTGIAPEVLERVFEPFFTTKGQGQGTGLGLSQVYGFCQQAGGIARIHSRLGEGTTVQMLLPAADEAPQPIEAPPPVPVAHGRLLLVEDNAEVAEATEPMLSSWGYAVRAARSGDAAKELLEQTRGGFDLLLTDIVMPGSTDGLSLARHVRRLYPGIGLVLMTGHARETDKAIAEGFVVLQKPWTPQALAEALEQAHPRRRGDAEVAQAG